MLKKNQKKNQPECLIFQEMELSTSKIEKNFVFQEMELFSSKIKKFLIFPEMVLSSLTFFYILGRKFPCPKNKKNASGFFFFFFPKKKFLYFGKWNFFIFSYLSYLTILEIELS